MKALRKRLTWILLPALFLMPILFFFLWFNRQVRQQRLDHALIVAINENDPTMVIALLDQGANANATDKPNQPITLKRTLADLWERMKGKKSLKDTDGGTPALLIPEEDQSASTIQYFESINSELVKALLEHGADPYATDRRGMMILPLAVEHNDIPTVKVLLEHHVDSNVKFQIPDPKGYEYAPLHFAYYECACLLIEHGADVNIRDSGGRTPLMILDSNDTKLMMLLLEHGADVNAQDKAGNTALFYADARKDVTSVRMLLKYGAKVSLKNKRGRTVLESSRGEDRDIQETLKDALRREQAEQRSSARSALK